MVSVREWEFCTWVTRTSSFCRRTVCWQTSSGRSTCWRGTTTRFRSRTIFCWVSRSRRRSSKRWEIWWRVESYRGARTRISSRFWIPLRTSSKIWETHNSGTSRTRSRERWISWKINRTGSSWSPGILFTSTSLTVTCRRPYTGMNITFRKIWGRWRRFPSTLRSFPVDRHRKSGWIWRFPRLWIGFSIWDLLWRRIFHGMS